MGKSDVCGLFQTRSFLESQWILRLRFPNNAPTKCSMFRGLGEAFNHCYVAAVLHNDKLGGRNFSALGLLVFSCIKVILRVECYII